MKDGKTPLPGFVQWFSHATDDPDQIALWAIENPGCNWAVAVGPSGLAVLDIDPPDGEQSLLLFELEHGELPATREHRSARGGRHLIFADPDKTCRNSVGALGPKLDTRGRNGYIVIPPSTFEGKSYEVLSDRPCQPLPATVVEALARVQDRVQAATGTSLDDPVQIGRAKRLLLDYVQRDDIAREGSGGDNRTYQVAAEVLNLGLSVHTAHSLIEEIWNPHCIPPWDSDDLLNKLENASRYAQNDAGAWAVPPVAERVSSQVLDTLIAQSPGDPGLSQQPEGQSETRTQKSDKFTWMDETIFRSMPEPVWLIENVFVRDSIALLYGPSGHYKSFLALHYASTVAMHGECAFYVAAEGIARMARLDFPAWKLANAQEGRIPFFMQDRMPNATFEGFNYDEFAKSVEAVAAAEGKSVGIVFLDTLNRAMLGLEENSAKDASILIEAADFLKRRLGCTVCLVHHTPKDGSEPRGSGAFYANMDTVIKCIADKKVKVARLHITKQKHAEEPELPFCFEGRKFGPGLAFLPITAKEARMMSADADLFSQKSIREALKTLKAFEPEEVTTDVLAHQLTPRLENDTAEIEAENVRRTRKGLLGAVKLGKLDGYHREKGKGLAWSLPSPD